MCNNNLNLVELLGNCPKGTKLYSPIFGEVIFEGILLDQTYSIHVKANDSEDYFFTKDGYYFVDFQSECLLFPSKEQRDWSKFEVYKDGDFLANTKDGRPFIFRSYNAEGHPIAYGGVDDTDIFFDVVERVGPWSYDPCRRATDSEIKFLRDKMKEAGYIWNAKNKTLHKDLSIDTLVIVSDSSLNTITINEFAIRRYAGGNCCFNNGSSSKGDEGEPTAWRHIIPLDKFTVTAAAIVKFKKEDDYGTGNG